ncbi:MAG: hypothetical protein FJ096_14520 [Deltaproteobacteria bacterium]|nr:hypothetical protein [Deltaproteobacteria bacterium]
MRHGRERPPGDDGTRPRVGGRRTHLRAHLLVVALLATASCGRRKEAPREILPVPVGTFRVDSVPEGELAEGTVEAFGLPLPRPMKVKSKLSDTVFATASLSLERVSNYFRDRVEAERIETAPKKTVFSGAKVQGSKRMLHIEVIARSSNIVDVVIRDQTQKPAPQGLTEEERWRQAGLTPDGRVLPAQNH